MDPLELDPLNASAFGRVKLETLTDFCQCCLSENDLLTMLPHSRNQNGYIELLTTCFSINITDNDLFEESQYLICKICEQKLKDSYVFRCQIEDSQNKLKDACNKTTVITLSSIQDDFSNESESDIIKTEYLCDDSLQSDLEEVEVTTLLSQETIDDEIAKCSETVKLKSAPQCSKKSETSDDAFSAAVENLLHNKKAKGKPERVRNNIKKLSKEDLKSYKRLYNRQRYAKLIPFKLKETSLSCDICRESFSTHKGLVSHMSSHYPNFVCDLCGKSFVLKSHLKSHINTHKVEKDTCPTCGKVLKKSSLTRHMKIHSGNSGIYACPHCTERFVSFSTRLNHMAEKHNIDTYRYNCKICSKKFRLSSSLSKHVRRCHFQELNCNCDRCGKGFFDRKSLEEHMMTHTGEKKFKCDICFKSYGRKSTIKEHMKIHQNVKTHVCSLCNKAFLQKCALKMHQKFHLKPHGIEEF